MADVRINFIGRDQVSGMMRGIGSVLSGITQNVASGLLQRGLEGIAGGFNNIFNRAGEAAGVESAFRGVADSADQMLAALRQGTRGTVLDVDLMRTYNKAAQLVSEDFANRLPDAMQYLQKVATSTGQDMGFLMDSLATGVARGSKLILDNIGIITDVEAANEAYASSIGKAASELTDQERQVALMNQVMERLAENTKSIPALAANSMKQLGATWGNLTTTIGRAFLPILNAALAPLGELATEYGPQLEAWAQRAAGWLGERLPAAIEAFKYAVQTVKDFIVSFRDTEWINDDTIRPIHQVAGVLGQVVRALGTDGLQGALTVLQPYIDSVFGQLGEAAGRLATVITEKIDAIDWSAVAAAIGRGMVVAIGIGTAVIGAEVDIGGKILAWLVERLSAVEWGPLGQAILTGLQTAFITLVTNLATILEPIAMQVVTWIQAQVPVVVAAFSAWASSFASWLPGATVQFLEQWPATLQTILDSIGGAVGPLLSKLGEWAAAFITWIVPMTPQLLAALAGVAVAIFIFIVETATVILYNLITQWVPAFLGWVADVRAQLRPKLNEMYETMVAWIGEAAGKLLGEAEAIGEAIGSGISAGIETAIAWVMEKLRALANMLPQWVKDQLGISSPSKVFMEIGEAMMQGWALGIQKNAQMVSGALAAAGGPISGLTVSDVRGALFAGDYLGAGRGIAYEGAGAPGVVERHYHISTPLDLEYVLYELKRLEANR